MPAESPCLDGSHDKRQLAAGGVTAENQDQAMRRRDVTIARAIIDRHVMPEWRASEEASRALEELAQDVV
jgi:hypothetical protein